MTNQNLEQLVIKTVIARNIAVAGLMVVIALSIIYAMWPSMVQRFQAQPIAAPVYDALSASKAPQTGSAVEAADSRFATPQASPSKTEPGQ
jgi:hypothetical protein